MASSDEIQNNPEYKRLRKLMDDPRYWKKQDPAYVEMIREGFRKLYDTPAEAGAAANEAGVNGDLHAQDDEVAHVTTGEVVLPLSAQTPEIMKLLYQTLGKDMIKYTVGSGAEQRNPTSGLAAFADDDQDRKDLEKEIRILEARIAAYKMAINAEPDPNRQTTMEIKLGYMEDDLNELNGIWAARYGDYR